MKELLRFERLVEVARQMKQPAILTSTLGANETHTLVRIPVLPACTSSMHFGLDFDSVVVTVRGAARDAPVPNVPVTILHFELAAPEIISFSCVAIGKSYTARYLAPKHTTMLAMLPDMFPHNSTRQVV